MVIFSPLYDLIIDYCRQTDVINNHHTHGLHAIPDNSETEGGIIHFQLSTHLQDEEMQPEQQAERLEETATLPPPTRDLLPGPPAYLYNGPECYIKPKSKSNLQIIRNAICAVCLAGAVNMSLKQKILVVRNHIATFGAPVRNHDTEYMQEGEKIVELPIQRS